MFTNKKKEDIDTFVCAVSLMSLKHKDQEPPLPLIPFGICRVWFCWTTFLETGVNENESVDELIYI